MPPFTFSCLLSELNCSPKFTLIHPRRSVRASADLSEVQRLPAFPTTPQAAVRYKLQSTLLLVTHFNGQVNNALKDMSQYMTMVTYLY